MNQMKIDTISKAKTWNIAWRSKRQLTTTEKHDLYKIAL